jgi:hypothetical protein|tara:strand:- start:103 stop:762 length:660 start_codon:yes stop_codon:yes gene_type:complete
MANELAKALCGFYADVGVIQQAAKSNYGQFADLPTVLSTVLPALAKHDLIQSQTFEPGPDGTTILVTTLMHVSGESIVSRLPLILGRNSNAMFALGGAITYFRRYALLSILGLSADVEADLEDYVEPATPVPEAAKPVKATTKRKSLINPPLDTEKGPDGKSERDKVIDSIKQLPEKKAAQVLDDFRLEFEITGPTVANHITSQAHAQFIADTIKALTE